MTSSAPQVAARCRASSELQAAITRRAPSRSAAPPTTPPAPSTSTCSPGCSAASQRTDVQAATDRPSAATRVSSTLSARGSARRRAQLRARPCCRRPAASRRWRGPYPCPGRHRGAFADQADAVHTRDVRQRLRAEVRGAACTEHVEGCDRCRCDRDQSVVLGRRRDRPLRGDRRDTVLLDYCGAHGSSGGRCQGKAEKCLRRTAYSF